MPLRLSSNDYESIKLMIEYGVLVPINPEMLPRSGFVKVVCPDGDTTPEMINHFHFGPCVEANGNTVCTHLAPVTGGPGAMPELSPMHALVYKDVTWATADTMVYWYIQGAIDVKAERVQNISLVPHAPCGMATLKNLTIMENFYLTMLAKAMIRKEFPHRFRSIKIMPHINFSGYPEAESQKGAFRTYLFKSEKFKKLCREQSINFCFSH